MDNTYWHKQTNESPLFTDLIWSRPESKNSAGKLLLIGGNSFGFSAVGEAYSSAIKAGIGTVRVMLPIAIKKVIGPFLSNGEFAPSNPSGSFSQKALDAWLDLATWSDGVLIAGDIGRNSETAILLEKFLQKYSGQVTITKDAIEYVTSQPKIIQNRSNNLLVLSLSQLQRLFVAYKSPRHITYTMGVPQLVDVLHDFTQTNSVYIVVKHQNNMVVAVDGKISSTSSVAGNDKIPENEKWRVSTAAKMAVWWLQNPSKPFESITTSVISS